MDLEQYDGKFLTLRYPKILAVRSEEPEWYAVSFDNRATAAVTINPATPIAESFSRSIRKKPMSHIEREGKIKTPSGIEGYERLIILIETIAWTIDAKSKGGHIVHIKLWATRDNWGNGAMWEDFVNSIEVSNHPKTRETLGSSHQITSSIRPIEEQLQLTGVLKKLPADLHYILRIAQKITSHHGEHLEETLDPINDVEEGLKSQMSYLSEQEARSRIKSDGARLVAWLQQYPPKDHPETAPLFAMISFFLNN